MTALLAQSKAHAADLIARLIKDCSEGVSDREKEAVSLAGLWVLDEEEVRGGFAEARELAKLRLTAAIARPPHSGAFKRRKLAPELKAVAAGVATKKISPEPQPGAAEADGSTIAAAATEQKAEAELETKGGLPMVLAPKLPVAWDDVIEAMNRRHAIIDNVGGKTVIAGWEPSQLNPERMVVVFQQKESFLLRYSNRTATIDVPDGRGGSRQSVEALGQWWLRHRQRRQHRGITFLPGGPEIVNECLNLWQGWGVEAKAW